MRLWFLLLIIVVMATVFACYEFYPRPAGSAPEVPGRLDASQTDTNLKSAKRLSQAVIDGVEKIVLFVGYRRSGHSIIGSMMDAHPNMVISHEYNLLPRCILQATRKPFPKNKSAIFNALYRNSYEQAMTGWRSEKNTSRGYNLHVSTPWHGAFTHLRVIGDKGGPKVSQMFFGHFQETKACLQVLLDIVKVPLIFFHVVRNPYDMIATELLLTRTNQFDMRAKDLIVAKPNDRAVKRYAKTLFKQATAVTRVMELATVVEIHSEISAELRPELCRYHSEDFVADPRKTVRDICSTLNLSCPEEYVEACYEKAYTNSSKSRHNMKWSPDTLQYVQNRMMNYSFFSRYI